MQVVSENFQRVLDSRKRDLSTVIEFYADNHVPDVTGFDPADAVRRYAKTRLTWNGHAYEPVLKSIGKASRFVSGKSNNISVKTSNVSRAYAAFILNAAVHGMWCVERRLSRSVTDSSMILFVGKWEPPGDTNKESGQLTAKQLISGVDYKLPPRKFTLDDPEGRSPEDPLSHSFRFQQITGNFSYQVPSTSTGSVIGAIFGGLFGFLFGPKKKKTTTKTASWSSFSATPLGDPIPEIICGRTQLPGIPLEFADISEAVKWLMAFCNGKVFAIEDIRNRTDGFSQPNNVTVHLGEPGGTGTQMHDPQFPNSSYYSDTAYVGGAVNGSKPEVADGPPTITGIPVAEMKLPDADGVYSLVGPSDNPIHGVRNLLTQSKYFNIPESLIYDEKNLIEAAYCDSPIIDDSQGERTFVPTDIEPLTTDGRIRRFNSSGTLRLSTYRHLLELDPDNIDILSDAIFELYDDADPPLSFAPVRYYRKRFTANLPVTGESQGLDVLTKSLCPAARIFILSDVNGRQKFVVEKPADSVLLTSPVSAGATSIVVESVEKWIGNLQGKVLIGVGRNEVQRATITGQPTGGTFTLEGASIPYNAIAGEVQTTLEAVFGVGNVQVTGNQGAAFTISFLNALGGTPLALLTASDALTGGTDPAVTVTRLVLGTDGTHSEVRKVSAIVYSTLGNAVTLEASATGGGVTATPSGATFTGGGGGTAASGTVTIGGTPAAGNTVKITIDGVEVELTVDALDTTGTIAGRLTDMIRAEPLLNSYITAVWDTVTLPNVVQIKALVGELQLESSLGAESTPLEYAHAAGEECIRVMMSFSDRPSRQADCPRSNILPGTFKFDDSRESHVNQVKLEFVDSRNDFARTPYEINDTPDQLRLRKTMPHELDGSAIDSLHQAARIAKGAFSKFVEGNQFYSWEAGYQANVLEEGDVLCVSDTSGEFNNIPCRIEELGLAEDGKTSIDARKYSTLMYSDDVEPHQIPLPTGLRDRARGTGRARIEVTGGAITVDTAQASNGTIEFYGTLEDDVIATLPSVQTHWTIINNTEGAFTLTIQTSGGNPVQIDQGVSALVENNGTNEDDDLQVVTDSTATDGLLEITADSPLAVDPPSGRTQNVKLNLAKFVFRETPSGTIDGVNTSFVLASLPVAGTEMFYVNGVLQEQGGGEDYNIIDDTITTATPLQVGDRPRVNYIAQ